MTHVLVTTYRSRDSVYHVVDADERVPYRRAFARTLCDHESEPGEDVDGALIDVVDVGGVCFCAIKSRYAPPRVVLTVVDPDGSVVEPTSSAARCAVRWATDRIESTSVILDTVAGSRHGVRDGDGVAVERGDSVRVPAHGTDLAASLPDGRAPMHRGQVALVADTTRRLDATDDRVRASDD